MVNIKLLKAVAPYGSNCYLISNNGEYAVIDPSADYDTAIKLYPELEGRLRYILVTHAHFDHILELASWADKADEVIVGELDASALSDSHMNCYLGFLGVDDGYNGSYRTVAEGDKLTLGDTEISVIDCPGHTVGGVSYKIGNAVFCGDTLFAGGGYGRCDLPGGDIAVLEKTLIKLITKLDDVTFYPGHGPETTLEETVYNFM